MKSPDAQVRKEPRKLVRERADREPTGIQGLVGKPAAQLVIHEHRPRTSSGFALRHHLRKRFEIIMRCTRSAVEEHEGQIRRFGRIQPVPDAAVRGRKASFPVRNFRAAARSRSASCGVRIILIHRFMLSLKALILCHDASILASESSPRAIAAFTASTTRAAT